MPGMSTCAPVAYALVGTAMLSLEPESAGHLFAGCEHVLECQAGSGERCPERLIEPADARQARLNSCVAM